MTRKDASLTEPTPLDWQVRLLRLSVFTSALPKHDPSDWWKFVAGTDPEITTVRAKEGKSETSGTVDNYLIRLVVSEEEDRVDWFFTPATEPSPTAGAVPTIGAMSEVVQEYLSRCTPWLEGFDAPITRLAFGAALMAESASKVEGYRKLIDLTKIPVDPENSSDALYRINRRRPDVVVGLSHLINRISTWSVMQYGGMKFRFGVAGGPPVIEADNPSFALSLELDINTVPEQDYVLPSDKIGEILHELVDLGSEIAAKGDVP